MVKCVIMAINVLTEGSRAMLGVTGAMLEEAGCVCAKCNGIKGYKGIESHFRVDSFRL